MSQVSYATIKVNSHDFLLFIYLYWWGSILYSNLSRNCFSAEGKYLSGSSLDIMDMNKIICSKWSFYFLCVSRLTSHIARPRYKGQMESPPSNVPLFNSLPGTSLYCRDPRACVWTPQPRSPSSVSDGFLVNSSPGTTPRTYRYAHQWYALPLRGQIEDEDCVLWEAGMGLFW